ncbi:MAG TPA: MobF family relaxase [Mycobacteriales bacterium]|nr:MobF family relaxase [Mycobacteriales bacterium]
MISVRPLAGGGAADYYLRREAGCQLGYYLDPGEPVGRWLGRGAGALELRGPLDQAGELALRRLLGGAHPVTGEQLTRPVWRAEPSSRLPARPLVTAIEQAARTRRLDVPWLLGDERLADTYLGVAAAAARRPFTRSLDPRVAQRLATAAGLDPVAVFRTADGTDAFGPALGRAGDRYDARNRGYDVCVSAPKSVSTLYALADAAIAVAIRCSHEVAAASALGYLDRETSHGLRGHQGHGQRAARITTNGFIAAAFSHETSRADDPQLHTHMVVANLTHGADGKWSAIDSRSLYWHATTASYLYHAVLRSELTRTLGVGWTSVDHGIAEVLGVPTDLQRAFSSRRTAIDAALATTGRSDPAAAQRACLATRPAKQPRDPAQLRARWAAIARQVGYRPVELVAGVRAAPPPAAVDVQRVVRELTGSAGLTRRHTTVARRDILQSLCEALPAGTPVSLPSLDQLTDLVTAEPRLVVPLRGTADEPRYSTAELLATERRALKVAAVLRASPTGRAAPCLPGRSLTAEQRRVARHLTLDDKQLTVLVGPAGSGKTATLAAAHRGWRAGGVPVHGAAVAALAARGLQAATGIPSTTLTRLLADLDRIDPRTGRAAGCLPGTTLVIDEAGMIDTRTLARLLDHAYNSSARLVLVGDPSQLPEIDAGGLFAALTQAPDTLTLAGNVRQVCEWERDALAQLRAGRTAEALTAYFDAGRIHVHRETADVHAAVASDYLQTAASPEAAGRAVILTSTRTEAAALNATIRRELSRRGHLHGPAVSVPTPGGTVEFAVGDAVLVTRNHRGYGVLNGTSGHVAGVDPEGQAIRIVDADGGEHHLDRRLLATGDVQHGYAMTVHKAQGATIDVALVSGTTALTKEAGYVALSRGRTANHLYTTPDDVHAVARNGGELGSRLVATVDRLAVQLGRTRRHRLASSYSLDPGLTAQRRIRSDPPQFHNRSDPLSRGLSR